MATAPAMYDVTKLGFSLVKLYFISLMFIFFITQKAAGKSKCEIRPKIRQTIYHMSERYSSFWKDVPDFQYDRRELDGILLDLYVSEKCGKVMATGDNGTHDNSLHGHKALFGHYPWHAFITNGTARCNGVLLSDRWVLTLASCKPSFRDVALGAQNSFHVPADGQRKVKQWFFPPNYEKDPITNNMALLLLDTPVKLRILITPACLQLDSTYGIDCRVSSFGPTDGLDQGELQRLDIKYVPYTVCQFLGRMNNEAFVGSKDCWKSASGNQYGICNDGDLGSPVVCFHPKKVVNMVVGLVDRHYSDLCGNVVFPFSTVRLDLQHGWIVETVNKVGN